MKKVLSVFLAALMLFSVMSFAASAVADERFFGANGAASTEQCVFYFNLNGGKVELPMFVYTDDHPKGTWLSAKELNEMQKFYVLPQDSLQYKKGTTVTLPAVEAPSGMEFLGWTREGDIGYEAPRGPFSEAPDAFKIDPDGRDSGRVIMLKASFRNGKAEVDTFSKVFDVLINVFGAILGVLVFKTDIAAGKAFVENLLGSIRG